MSTTSFRASSLVRLLCCWLSGCGEWLEHVYAPCYNLYDYTSNFRYEGCIVFKKGGNRRVVVAADLVLGRSLFSLGGGKGSRLGAAARGGMDFYIKKRGSKQLA